MMGDENGENRDNELTNGKLGEREEKKT